MSIAKRLVMIFSVLVSCVGCDQSTKSVAQSMLSETAGWSFLGDTVRFQLAHNPGAFLGLGASLPEAWRVGVLSICVAGMLVALLGYTLFAKSVSPSSIFAIALLLAGGVGNLIDRLMYDGYVIDFINIGIGPLRTGIFNVADIAVTAGVLIFMVDSLHEKNNVE